MHAAAHLLRQGSALNISDSTSSPRPSTWTGQCGSRCNQSDRFDVSCEADAGTLKCMPHILVVQRSSNWSAHDCAAVVASLLASTASMADAWLQKAL